MGLGCLMVNISKLWLKLVLGFGCDGSGFGSGQSRFGARVGLLG